MCEYRSRQTPDSIAARRTLIDLADTCDRIADGRELDELDAQFLEDAKGCVDRIDTLNEFMRSQGESGGAIVLRRGDDLVHQVLSRKRDGYLPVPSIGAEIALTPHNPALAKIIGDLAFNGEAYLAAHPEGKYN